MMADDTSGDSDRREEWNDSKHSINALNAHAISRITALTLFGFQILSGVRMSRNTNSISTNKHLQLLRQVHPRIVAPLTAVSWITAIMTGLYYLLAAQRVTDKQVDWYAYGKSNFRFYHFVGVIASMTNLSNGIFALVGNIPKEKDYVLHKGSMYFCFYWIVSNNYMKLVRSLLIWKLPCEVDGATILLASAITATIEFLIYVSIGYCYGGTSYRRKFVSYNLIGFGSVLVVTWVAIL